ncbi:ricin-type beta-trefoil lectin domain protein [Kitasatospora viridis]|uniref:ricin-type beta-trefoil lectin domain protein n=1 Tax=Kitasatospora viridis TaxID=281105 RepID=UPI00119D8550|nr:ricin-type beta-trefoil lectin domain protein [Kitasatospora viridis]
MTTALTTALAGSALPALAAPIGPADPTAKPPTAQVAPGPTQIAQAQAKKTGKPVTVDALTTETSLTVANPDGSLTTSQNVLPIRVKQSNGSWAGVDATLAKNGDGSFSPKVAASGVALSGGGSAPLVALTDPAGHKLALSLPFALPVPSVSGDTATYANVLPGVDLQATVTDQGAFHEVLVVHNAQAAADPQLKTLRLAINSNGLSTAADGAGNVTAKAADGTPAFTAPAPVMWDSATAPAPVQPSVARSAAAPADAAPRAAVAQGTPDAPPAPQSAVDPATQAVSTKDGPGHGAHIAKIAVQADNSGLTLAPDAGQLASSDVVYPEYIDPAWQPAPTGTTNHYTEVKEGCAGQGLYDNAQENGEGVGYQQYDSNCFGIYRSYYEMNTSALTTNMVIQSSQLHLAETYGADHTCSDTWGIGLNLTGGISGGTSWNNQPGTVTGEGTQNIGPVYGSCGTNPNVTFDVTGSVKQYLGYSNLTFGIYGNESKYSTNYGFMRFSTNPVLQTNYDIAPNTPSGMYTDPYTICGTTGWIGQTTMNGNASNINLHAWVSTAMPGDNLQTSFHVWDNMTNNGSGGAKDFSWVASNTVASGNWTGANIGGVVQDGHTYGWNATATDGTLNSPGSGYCYFSVDLTPPSIASFTPSAQYPPLGSGITPQSYAGSGTVNIQVSSTDPTPTGCNLAACIKSGVAKFLWSLDQNNPVSGGNAINVTPDANGTATASIPVNLSTNQWGTHTLYVQAVDGAGNTQATVAQYSFYAPFNPAAKAVAGDLTGDGIPDTIVPDPAGKGNLTLIPGNADPAATPQVASTQAQSPDTTSWNNYLVTHRGSQSQSTLDDIWAYQTKTHQMYLYRNDGTTIGGGVAGQFTKSQDVLTVGRPAVASSCTIADCASYGTDWSGVSQMVAPGAYSNAANWAGAGVSPYADLITVENGKLWYYTGSARAGSNLGNAYLIGAQGTNWSNVTLIAPGSVGATVANGTESGGTPTLWVRDNATGAIASYPLTFDSNGLPNSSLTPPGRAALSSGLTDTSGNRLCLDGGAGNSGTAAQMWDCNTTNPQTVTYGADNTIHLMGKCLDVQNGGTGNGNPIQLFQCNNSGSQKWVAGPTAGALKNPQSGRCLADPAANQNQGTPLILWDCDGGSEQQWAGATANNALPAQTPVLPVGLGQADWPTVTSPGDVNADGNPDLLAINGSNQMTEFLGTAPVNSLAQVGGPMYLGTVNGAVQTEVQSNYGGNCLDNYGGTKGTPVVEWGCWGGASQKFNFATDGTLRSAGECVATTNAGTGNGTGVISADCAPGHPEQQWVLKSDGTIRNPASGRCLELPGWNMTNGTALDIWDCIAGDANQQWTVHTF